MPSRSAASEGDIGGRDGHREIDLLAPCESARIANLLFSIAFGGATVVGCATGSEGGGDPGTSVDSTQPQAQSDDAGPKSEPPGNGGNGGANASSGSEDSGTGGGQTDSGAAGGGGTCQGYADPNTPANCVDTAYCGGSKPACNPNGCDTTYWCTLSNKKCVKKPSGC